MRKWFTRLSSVLVGSIALAAPAMAARIVALTLAGGTLAVAVTGQIVPEDAAEFSRVAGPLRNPIVILSGPGGRVLPALQIGVEIHNRGLATLVPADAYCASACTFIWLAGERRMMGEGARIGFHAMSVQRGDGRALEVHSADDALRQYLTDLGFAFDTTATIVNTPAALVRWLDPIELNANGIETERYP
jgi:hypothetical protein